MLEFAFVAPILALLIMAIFQFAFVLETQIGLTNAVREAARRVAATKPDAPVAWSGANSLTEWTQEQLCGDATLPCDGGLLRENVQAFEGARLTTDPPPVTFCTYSVQTASGLATEFRVEIGITYAHPVFFPLLAFATDALDGTSDGRWNLSASAQMRLEKIDPSSPGFVAPAGCT